jgi:hypothetical protein
MWTQEGQKVERDSKKGKAVGGVVDISYPGVRNKNTATRHEEEAYYHQPPRRTSCPFLTPTSFLPLLIPFRLSQSTQMTESDEQGQQLRCGESDLG